MEATAVNADDNPCVLEKRVVLLKELDVFIARLCHLGERSVEADEQQGSLVLGKRLGGEDGGQIAKRGCGGRSREPRKEELWGREAVQRGDGGVRGSCRGGASMRGLEITAQCWQPAGAAM